VKIFNSLSQKLEEFKPLKSKKVTIYVCGITPYDTTHLGHAFTYISFDTLIRYLKFKGFEVVYTQNVTDINDRDKDILQRAKEQNISWQKLSDFWTIKFLEDMKVLNWIFPAHFLKASEQISSMTRLIQKLLDKKLAYLLNGSVYLDISKCPDYGKLSGLNRSKMLKIAKDFEEDLDNSDKIHPLDITLWRGTLASHIGSGNVNIPSFDSPYGKGRPGWHIECSAMSTATLGERIDIHGGGKDLKFPHHEAEIVQSEGATGKKPFAKYWLHTGTVFYQGEKMSKSKGNLVMVSDLTTKYSPNAVRWLILSHHWSKDWGYKQANLIKAQEEVEIIEKALSAYADSSNQQFYKIMDNNLDTPKALKLLLKLAKQKSKGLKTFYTSLGFI